MGACTSIHARRQPSEGRGSACAVAEPQSRPLQPGNVSIERSRCQPSDSIEKQRRANEKPLNSSNSQHQSKKGSEKLSLDAQALEEPKSRPERISCMAGAGRQELAHERKSECPMFILDARSPPQQRVHRMSSESIQVFSHESLSKVHGRRYSMWQRYKLKRKFKNRRCTSTRNSSSTKSNTTTSRRRFSRRFTFRTRSSAAAASASLLLNAGEEREQHEQLMNDYLSVSMCAGGSFTDVQDEHEAGGGEPEELSLYYQRQRRWRAAAAQLRTVHEERKAKRHLENLATYPELWVSARPHHDDDNDDDESSRRSSSKKRRSLTATSSRSRSTPDLSECSRSRESGDSDYDSGVSKPSSPPPGAPDHIENQIERHQDDLPALTPPCGSPRAGSPAKKRLPESSGPHFLQNRARNSGSDAHFQRPVPIQRPGRQRASSVACLPLPEKSKAQSTNSMHKRLLIEHAPRVRSSNASEARKNSKPLRASDVSLSVSPNREFKAPNPVVSRTRLMRGQLTHQAQLEREHLEHKKRHLRERVREAHHKPRTPSESSAAVVHTESSVRSSPARDYRQRSRYYSPPTPLKEFSERRIHREKSLSSSPLRKSSALVPMSPHTKPVCSRVRLRSNSLSASLSMVNTSGDSLYFHPRVMQEHVNIAVPQFSLSPERIARAREIHASSLSVPKL